MVQPVCFDNPRVHRWHRMISFFIVKTHLGADHQLRNAVHHRDCCCGDGSLLVPVGALQPGRWGVAREGVRGERKRKSGSFRCHVCIISPVLELVVGGERVAAVAKQKQGNKQRKRLQVWFTGHLWQTGEIIYQLTVSLCNMISNGMQKFFHSEYYTKTMQ